MFEFHSFKGSESINDRDKFSSRGFTDFPPFKPAYVVRAKFRKFAKCSLRNTEPSSCIFAFLRGNESHLRTLNYIYVLYCTVA